MSPFRILGVYSVPRNYSVPFLLPTEHRNGRQVRNRPVPFLMIPEPNTPLWNVVYPASMCFQIDLFYHGTSSMVNTFSGLTLGPPRNLFELRERSLLLGLGICFARKDTDYSSETIEVQICPKFTRKIHQHPLHQFISVRFLVQYTFILYRFYIIDIDTFSYNFGQT